jgi:hypothetical protein
MYKEEENHCDMHASLRLLADPFLITSRTDPLSSCDKVSQPGKLSTVAVGDISKKQLTWYQPWPSSLDETRT